MEGIIAQYPICKNCGHKLIDKTGQKTVFDHIPEHSDYCDCKKPEVDPKSIAHRPRVAPDGTFIEY